MPTTLEVSVYLVKVDYEQLPTIIARSCQGSRSQRMNQSAVHTRVLVSYPTVTELNPSFYCRHAAKLAYPNVQVKCPMYILIQKQGILPHDFDRDKDCPGASAGT